MLVTLERVSRKMLESTRLKGLNVEELTISMQPIEHQRNAI